MADQKSIGAQLDETLAQLATKDEVRTIVREEIEGNVPGMVRGGIEATVPQMMRAEIKATVPQMMRAEIEATVPQMIRSELRAVIPEIVREINAHTDKVHGELREDLREQGIRVRPMGSRTG